MSRNRLDTFVAVLDVLAESSWADASAVLDAIGRLREHQLLQGLLASHHDEAARDTATVKPIRGSART